MSTVFLWYMPEPGPEVQRVCDSDGDVWSRVTGGWSYGPGWPVTEWADLLGISHCEHGLVDCTNEKE